jgi:hypothetical protein
MDKLSILEEQIRHRIKRTKNQIHSTHNREGGFSGRCLESPGAISQGETLEELRVNNTDGNRSLSMMIKITCD